MAEEAQAVKAEPLVSPVPLASTGDVVIKRRLVVVFGICIVIALLGYTGLTAYSLIRWNDGTSHSLITGYVLMVAGLITGFVKWMES